MPLPQPGTLPHPRPPQLSLSSEDATQVFLFQGVLPDYHGPGHPSCVFITVPSAEFITVQSWVCLFHQGMECMRVFKVKVLAVQLCLTLCEPTDCSLPGSSVHGILQAIILEWVAIPSSRGSFWPMDQTWVSCVAGGFFAIWATSIYTFPCVFIRCLPFLSFYIFYLFFWLRYT